MLIRQLRENEAHKSAALMAAAFGFNTNIDEKREEKLDEEFWGAFDDDGETLMAQIAAKDYRSYLGGKALGTLGDSGCFHASGVQKKRLHTRCVRQTVSDGA